MLILTMATASPVTSVMGSFRTINKDLVHLSLPNLDLDFNISKIHLYGKKSALWKIRQSPSTHYHYIRGNNAHINLIAT